MRDCTAFQKYFSPYLDHELSEEELLQFNGHLAQCEDCSTKLEIYRRLSVKVQNSAVQAPTVISEHVNREIHRRSLEAAEEKAKQKQGRISDLARKKSHAGSVAGVLTVMLLAFAVGLVIPSPVKDHFRLSAVWNTAAADSQAAESIQPAITEAPVEQLITSEEAQPAETEVVNVSDIKIFYSDAEISDFTVHVGDEPLTLSTAIYPLSIHDLPSLSSSDDSVLVVSDNGDGTCLVTARSSGNASVVASYKGFESRCNVYVVNDGGFSIDVGIYSYGTRVYDITIPQWSSITLSAAPVDGTIYNGTVEWDSDSDILLLEPYGNNGVTVTGEQTGTTYIYADVGGLRCKCVVRVSSGSN